MRNVVKTIQNERGQVVLFVSLLIATVSLVGIVGLYQFSASNANTQSFINQQKTFFLAEGVRKIALAQLGSYLQATTQISDGDLTNKLLTNLPAMIPSGYSLQAVSVKVLNHIDNAVLPSGPFAGMQSPITNLNLIVSIKSNSTNVISTVNSTVSLGSVFPFQFLIFADMPYADWHPGPNMDIIGRVHVNGDACLGSDALLRFGLVTASGRLMFGSDSRCKFSTPSAGRVQISNNTNYTAFSDFKLSGDNACTNCAGTSQAWSNYARLTWNSNALDQAQGSQVLRLPGAGVQNQSQFGINGNSFAPTSNQANTRFSIDPPLASDSTTIAQQKYANESDIRVIDGVWYLKDPSNTSNWPGIPIWSDHPGRADATFGMPEVSSNETIAVGQDDIRDYWAAQGITTTWTPAGPHLFSYYEYDKLSGTLQLDPSGIISYGNLGPNLSAILGPAGWFTNTSSSLTTSPICMNAVMTCGPPTGLVSSVPPPLSCAGGTQAVTCGGLVSPPSQSTFILNATRGGFRDQHIQLGSPPPNQLARSKIYPINFDMGQFQAALVNTGIGELGSYFGVGRFIPRAFNGIIYVTGVWPGSLNGFGAGVPTEYPYQGSVVDSGQMAAISPSEQEALPIELCSNSPSLPHAGLAGSPFDQVLGLPPVSRFKVPDCAAYSVSGITAYPNAVRVYNGKNFNSTTLPKGISLVTNLPMYLVGDYNSNSNSTSSTSMPWTSSMLGSDNFTLLSNNWTDAKDNWDNPPAYPARVATTTSINTALLTGYMRDSVGLQFHGITAYLENWSGTQMNLTGSIVVGFYPVYHLAPPVNGGAYGPPVRNYVFDPHFSLLTNQPPGTLVYPVSAVSTWQGD